MLFGEYVDNDYGTTMCCFVWLKHSGRGGPSFAWTKGENLWSSYVGEKADINTADLTSILSAIKKKFPGSIGELMGFDDSYMYQGE